MMFSNTLHINCHTFPDEYSTHATNVLCGLDELRQSGSLFDVSLIIEGQRFQVRMDLRIFKCSIFVCKK